MLPKYLHSIILEYYRVLCFKLQLVHLSLPAPHREHSVVIFSLSTASSASVRTSEGKHCLPYKDKYKSTWGFVYDVIFVGL